MVHRPTASPVHGLIAALIVLGCAAAATAATAAATAPPRRPPLIATRAATPTPTRAVTALPEALSLKGGALPFAGGGAASDTFLLGSYGFQTYTDACATRGWLGEDRTSKVFANVSGAALVNRDIVSGFGPSSPLTLPAPLAGTTIGTPGASAVDANGDLVYYDTLNGPVRADRVAGQLLTFAPELPTSQTWESAALDPTTGGIVVAPRNPGSPSGLWAYPAGGGGAAVQIAGFGAATEDTTVADGRITGPGQIAIDAAGNIYFTEPGMHRVRMLRKNDGRLVTLAGTGVAGSSGDGGPAAAAQLSHPTGVAVAADGSRLWIADRVEGRVRLVADPLGPDPQIDTYALLASPRYLVLSGGRLFATLNSGGDFPTGRVIELLPGGASAPSLGYPDGGSIYATSAERAVAQMHNVYDPGAPAPDGDGGYFTSDPTARLVVHVQADGTVETAAGANYGVHMGNFALRVGTDMATAPDEVGNWVNPEGYGNDWSQRLISPPVALAGAGTVLRFDFSLELQGGLEGMLTGNSYNELLGVQIEQADGTWASVHMRILEPLNGTFSAGFPLAVGRGIFKGEIHFDADVSPGLVPATPTRLRWVVQTAPQGTAEDGTGAPFRAAAVIDNIELRDGANTLLLAQDFESGTLGAWSLAAMNGTSSAPGVMLFYIRDTPPPATQVEPRSGFDFTDPTCVWQFTSPGGEVLPGVHARLTSPWVMRAGAADSVEITFSGKLANRGTARRLRMWARGKNVGDTHPRWATSSFFLLDSGVNGPDAASPFVNQRVTRFPADFQPVADGTACDSIQFFFQVEDHWEQALAGGSFQDAYGRGGMLPILDDIRVYQRGVDRDRDGIADAQDTDPDVSAAGQDADGDGAIDPTATFRHVESWDRSRLPLHYRVSQQAVPAITGNTDLQAIQWAFGAWADVRGTDLVLVNDGTVTPTAADALDGLSLVTFEDVDFDFPPDIIGVTPTLSFTRQGVYDDRVVRPGEILDADMIFNPAAQFRTATEGDPRSLDLQSVVTHEVGHLLGLNHSGVLDASMFFVIQSGTLGASLTDDDRAAVSAAYPAADFGASFGAVTGTVTRGANGLPIPGALVTAVRLAGAMPEDSTASDYTREDGSFALRRLPPGDYAVRVTPLDGDLDGWPLTPERIGPRIAAVAQTNFQAEWWSAPETDRDDPTLLAPIAVAAGISVPDVHVVTNVDTLPPRIEGVTPPADSTGLRIDTSVLVSFSERIDPATLKAAFRLHAAGDTLRLGGNGVLLGLGRTFVFAPSASLAFDTDYVLDITTALADREGVHLAVPFSTGFRTEPKPAIQLTSVQPAGAPVGALITLLGAGFDPTPAENIVHFPCPTCGGETTLVALSATASALVVAVPPTAVSGLVKVSTSAGPSNSLSFSVLPPQPITTPTRLGADIALTFSPTDVAVAPDGNTVFAVGDGGLAIVNLDPNRPSYRIPVDRPIGASRSLALTPDGFRAAITRPDEHDVAIVDVNPSSGGFGDLITTVAVASDSGPSEPDNVTISPDGRRAFVNDITSRLVFEIDLDVSSVTCNQVVGTRDTRGALPSGALVATPDGTTLLVGTANQGLMSLLLPDSAVTVRTANIGRSGAITPAGNQALFTRGTGLYAAGGAVLLVGLKDGLADAGITLGGTVRDVAILPQGPAGYIANGTLNRLQVVSLDPASPLYKTKIAEVATGASPQAVGVSAFGNLVAVANAASRDLSLFRPLGASGDEVRTVTPEVAFPGQPVGVMGNGDWMTSGTQVDIGTGPFDPTRFWNGTACSFEVPPLTQRATDIVVQASTGGRTLPRPFRVVDPIASPGVNETGVVDTQIVPGSVIGTLAHDFQHMCISPDGRLLAVGRYLSADPVLSGSYVDLYRISSDAAQPFGQAIGRFKVSSTGDNIRDMGFTPDGQFLWRGNDGLATGIFDVRPSSPTFGTIVQPLDSDPDASDMMTLATDPMGRYMVLGAWIRHSLTFWYPDGLGKDWVVNLPDVPWSSAISPDGRWVITGGEGRATLVDVDNRSVAPVTTPQHGTPAGYPTRVRSIAVSRDGKRAAGLFPGDVLAIWNLDPAAGAVGAELFFGPFLPTAGVPASSELVAGTDLTSILVAQGPSLVRVDLRTAPPAVTGIASADPIGLFAVSPDGRQLWTSRAGVDGGGQNFGQVELYGLSNAVALALLAGGGQSGLPAALLPTPVRVRVASAGNRPLAGALVEFSIPAGALDGGPTLLRRLTDSQGEAVVQWQLPGTIGPTAMTVRVLGSSLAPLSVDATVAPDDSSIEPVIVSFGPADGATGLGAATPVAVRFNQRMDSLTTVARMQLFADDQPVAGTFRFEDGGRYVLFTPRALLPYAARCSLVVLPGALDREGQALAAGGLSVFTVQLPPTLELHAITPPAAPEGAPIVLDGAGFSAVPSQNTVLVNGRLAGVTSASTTSLVLHIPTGATSGPVTVQVGAATSNPRNLVVTTGSGVGGSVATIDAEAGASRVTITPDGQRALVANGQTNTVTALDLKTLRTLESTPVGLAPQGVVILPNDPQGARAYVCNNGSDDVSVLDIALGSPSIYTVVKTIPVGSRPAAIGVTALGPQVLVVNAGSNTVSIIDADESHGTFDAVTASVNVGSSGQAIAVSPDGGRAYVVTAGGEMVTLDLGSHAVTASVNVGSSGQAIAVSPDGGTVLVLLASGTLIAIDVVPGSPHENQVVASVNVGSSGQAIAVSPDGGTAYVTTDANTVVVVQIGDAPPGSTSSVQPGPAISLTIVKTIAVGDAPAGVAVDPSGSGLVLVANVGSGTLSIIGSPDVAPPVAVEFDFNPNALNLKSLGRWVNARLEPPAPWRAGQIRLDSVRLMGVVPIDGAAHVTYGDGDCDGVPDLTVKFSRQAASLAVPAGSKVFVRCTGLLDSTVTRTFEGVDSIKVLRSRVLAPVAQASLSPGAAYTLRWEASLEGDDDQATPAGHHLVRSVSVLHTVDGGATWVTDLVGLPNTGSAEWTVPATATDSAKVAVILDTGDDDVPAPPAEDESPQDRVSGVLAVSDPFRIVGPSTAGVDAMPVALQFAPLRPNPAHGPVSLRFGLPVATPVRLEVFDVAGRRVRVLADGVHPAGWHEARWRGENESRSRVGAGLYFVRLQAQGRTFQQRLVWIP